MSTDVAEPTREMAITNHRTVVALALGLSVSGLDAADCVEELARNTPTRVLIDARNHLDDLEYHTPAISERARHLLTAALDRATETTQLRYWPDRPSLQRM